MKRDKISSLKSEADYLLVDEYDLLDAMMHDSNNQSPLYKPGPYWVDKLKNSAKEIKKHGISEFRGSTNNIGLSYTDCLYLDVRNQYSDGLARLAQLATRIFPVSKIFESQIKWTESYANTCIQYAQEILNTKDKVNYLLDEYVLPFSLLGNCLNKVKIDEEYYAIHYLNLLEQHDNLAKQIKFNKARSVFEIGGGFGANVHILLENYKNIRKVIYLDLPPNLYVGTQYLKAFYGESVFDYRALELSDSIEFSSDDSLEIFCIAPWQIEKIDTSIDIFMNSHSFVEMAPDIVKNYANKYINMNTELDSAIALVTYDEFDLDTTIAPEKLPLYFNGRSFRNFRRQTLLESEKSNIYYVSPGKLHM